MTDETVELVLVQKDGELLEVHPTTVKAHEAAGWKVVYEAAEDVAEPDEKPAGGKKGVADK